MKNRQLQDLLEQFPEEADIKIRVSIVVPADLEDASESDVLIDDGELLEIGDSRAVLLFNNHEVHIVADKVFDW